MSIFYEHQINDIDAYRTATTIYEGLLEEWPGTVEIKRAGAYLETVDYCRREFGDSSGELVAALNYLAKWLTPLEPRQATNAFLAMLQTEINLDGSPSSELAQRLDDFRQFLGDQQKRTSFAPQASSAAAWLATYFGSPGPENLGLPPEEVDSPFFAIERAVRDLEGAFSAEHFLLLLGKFIAAFEPFGYSSAIEPLLECLHSGVDDSFEVPDIPTNWAAVTLSNLSDPLRAGLLLRPNRGLSSIEREIHALGSVGRNQKKAQKAHELLIQVQERTALIFKDLPHLDAIVNSNFVLSQLPEESHRNFSLSILLGDQSRELNRNPQSLEFHDIRFLSLYDNSLDERDLNRIRFDHYTSLKAVQLSGNLLRRLPRVLEKHKSLESLDLSNNLYLELEASDLDLPNLKYLDLRGTKVSAEEVAALRTRYPSAEILGKEIIKKPPVVEQTEFAVLMTSIGPQKVKVIKALSELLSLSLKEAKQLVDHSPAPLAAGLPKDEAKSLKEELETLGASVEMK